MKVSIRGEWGSQKMDLSMTDPAEDGYEKKSHIALFWYFFYYCYKVDILFIVEGAFYMTDTVLDNRKMLAGLKFPIQPELKLLWILRKEKALSSGCWTCPREEVLWKHSAGSGPNWVGMMENASQAGEICDEPWKMKESFLGREEGRERTVHTE